MKTKVLAVIAFLILTLSGLIFNNSESSITVSSSPVLASIQTQQKNRWLDKFYIGAVHDGTDCQSNYYKNLDTLGFNIWHMYDSHTKNGRPYPLMFWYCGNILNDSLFTPVSAYKDVVNNQIRLIYESNPEMRIVTMRPKIEYLCYGQRSDYQCDSILISDDLWFYSFNNHDTGRDTIDNSQYGNGEKVRYCKVNHNQTDGGANWVVRRLKANTEQCRRGLNEWHWDSYCDWLIKPRIRIDSAFANNPANFSKLVCGIHVLDQDSNIIKKADIRVRNFKFNPHPDSVYKGNYLEEFYFSPYNDTSSLKIIERDWGDLYQYKARGTCANDDSVENKADIQVYWYGNCDMWIDYVRVDNDVADRLFKGYYDNPVYPDLRWIKNEVKEIGMITGSPPVFMKYYLEHVEFNNLPCLAYVNEKLKCYSYNKIDLIQDMVNSISYHVPWNRRTTIENASFLDSHYIKKVGFTQVFSESYPMTACYDPPYDDISRIPNTLPCSDTLCNDRILAKPVSPEVYDDWLQDNINYPRYSLEGYDEDTQCSSLSNWQDKGNFRYRMQMCDTLSKLSDIPFIFMPQAHQWYNIEVRREPTNEELNMMANVSVSYGARGLLYFWYYSFTNNKHYGIGMIDLPNNLRGKNVYGQENPNKWQTFQSIANRLSNKWEPFLIKFDNANRHSFIFDFQNERDELIQNTPVIAESSR